MRKVVAILAWMVASAMSMGANAAGTHNLYVHDIFNEWASNSNLLLWSVNFDCNPEQYTVAYSYTPYPSSMLTISFSGPFTDRPCAKFPYLGETFYFSGTIQFSIENFQAPMGVCTIPFGMGWGEPTWGIKRHYGKTLGPISCSSRRNWYQSYQTDAYTWLVQPCSTCVPSVTGD